MKKIFHISTLAALTIGLLASCSKPASTPSPALVAPAPSMTATVDSVSWVAITFLATTSSGTLKIEAAKPDGSEFIFSVPANTPTGSFKAGGISSYQGIYQVGTNYSILTSGTFGVASNANNAIAGTFSGTFTNSTTNAVTTVTNGKFTASYN